MANDSGFRQFWRETPGVARAGLILAAATGVYYALGIGVLTGGVGLVMMGFQFVMGIGYLVLIALALRSTSVGFAWTGVALAALVVLVGVFWSVLGLLNVGQISSMSVLTTTLEIAFFWAPPIVLGIAYVPIVVLGARRALTLRQAGPGGVSGPRPVAGPS